MNIEAFYEYVILRDILAYILPGGICLAGIATIVQPLESDGWDKLLPHLSGLNSWLSVTLLVMVAFLIGHILDMAYRNLLQGGDWYRRPKTVRKMLTGSTIAGFETEIDPLAYGIREAVGQFLNIDWEDTPIEQWISSGKAFEANVILGYWIEQEDPRLFDTEIGRPIVQAHFLHATGLAFLFLGICIFLAEVVHGVGFAHSQTSDPIAVMMVLAASWLLGFMLVRQGGHKRDILIEHTFRAFYVVWRRGALEQTEDARGGAKKIPSINQNESQKK